MQWRKRRNDQYWYSESYVGENERNVSDNDEANESINLREEEMT